MRVLVCGGRDFIDGAAVKSALDALPEGPLTIIEGGASGADNFARLWAEFRGVPCETYRADWSAHGRAAGPIRNKQMLDEGKPDLVIAFPGGRGTANMIKQARVAGVRVELRED